MNDIFFTNTGSNPVDRINFKDGKQVKYNLYNELRIQTLQFRSPSILKKYQKALRNLPTFNKFPE